MASVPQERAADAIDIDAVRARLNAHRAEHKLSWNEQWLG